MSSFDFTSLKGDNVFRCDFHKLGPDDVVSKTDYCLIKSKDALSCYALVQYAQSKGFFADWILDKICQIIDFDLTDLKDEYNKLNPSRHV